MGLTDKMDQLANQMKTGAQATSLKVFSGILRLVTGLLLGLTIALVFQELIKFGTFSLVFITIVIFGIFFRFSKDWSIPQILIFDLICVLTAQLLRMYILLAPGA